MRDEGSQPAVYETVFGKKFFEMVSSDSERAENFNRAMNTGTTSLSTIFAHYNFSNCFTVTDVGGGIGEFLHPLLEKFPGIKTGVLFDLEKVISEAKKVAGSRNEGRVEYVGGNFFGDVPMAECFTLRCILHDWNDTDALRILEAVRRKMNATSKMVVITLLLREDHFSLNYLVDFWMAMAFSSKERTLGEFTALFKKSGLKVNRVIHTASPFSLLEVVIDK